MEEADYIYRQPNEENENKEEFEKMAFIFCLVSFATLLFMTPFAIPSGIIGTVFSVKGKRKLYLIANILCSITALVMMIITFKSMGE